MSLGLVLLLVWLNDNPLFGGQVQPTLIGAAARRNAWPRHRGIRRPTAAEAST